MTLGTQFHTSKVCSVNISFLDAGTLEKRQNNFDAPCLSLSATVLWATTAQHSTVQHRTIKMNGSLEFPVSCGTLRDKSFWLIRTRHLLSLNNFHGCNMSFTVIELWTWSWNIHKLPPAYVFIVSCLIMERAKFTFLCYRLNNIYEQFCNPVFVFWKNLVRFSAHKSAVLLSVVCFS